MWRDRVLFTTQVLSPGTELHYVSALDAESGSFRLWKRIETEKNSELTLRQL